MKTAIIQRLTVAVVFLIALAFLAIPGALAAPTEGAVAAGPMLANDGAEPLIRARRAISIPFGIDSTLQLSDLGRLVHVTGHGECQEGGDSYDVRATVTQDATGARAKSHYVTFDCSDDWTVDAEAQGPRRFEPGDAEICAMALTRVSQGGTWVNQWCKDVELE